MNTEPPWFGDPGTEPMGTFDQIASQKLQIPWRRNVNGQERAVRAVQRTGQYWFLRRTAAAKPLLLAIKGLSERYVNDRKLESNKDGALLLVYYWDGEDREMIHRFLIWNLHVFFRREVTVWNVHE